MIIDYYTTADLTPFPYSLSKENIQQINLNNAYAESKPKGDGVIARTLDNGNQFDTFDFE